MGDGGRRISRIASRFDAGWRRRRSLPARSDAPMQAEEVVAARGQGDDRLRARVGLRACVELGRDHGLGRRPVYGQDPAVDSRNPGHQIPPRELGPDVIVVASQQGGRPEPAWREPAALPVRRNRGRDSGRWTCCRRGRRRLGTLGYHPRDAAVRVRRSAGGHGGPCAAARRAGGPPRPRHPPLPAVRRRHPGRREVPRAGGQRERSHLFREQPGGITSQRAARASSGGRGRLWAAGASFLAPEFRRAGRSAPASSPPARPPRAHHGSGRLRQDGQPFPVEVSLGTWSGPDGTFFTHRAPISERGRRWPPCARRKFRAVLEGSAAAVFIIDEGRVRYANQAAAALTGASVRRPRRSRLPRPLPCRLPRHRPPPRPEGAVARRGRPPLRGAPDRRRRPLGGAHGPRPRLRRPSDLAGDRLRRHRAPPGRGGHARVRAAHARHPRDRPARGRAPRPRGRASPTATPSSWSWSATRRRT